MFFSPLFLAPLLAASYVSAHGILTRISINGKVFEKNAPSVIRLVTVQNPIKGATNPALTCGLDSAPAQENADASPGDTITFDWKTASGGNWPHNTGPMETYMASCGSVTCDKFNQAQAKWFKIDQVGKSSPGIWAQGELMKGAVASVKLPQNIAPGGYLIRHEIIALHLGTSRLGAEFYAGCAQLNIGGNGTGVPTANELVSLPGAYSDDDPGIFDPTVFEPNAPYVFPGPPVATFVTGQGSQNSPSGTPSVPTDLPQSSPQPSPPSPTRSCRRKPAPSSVDSPAVTLIAAPEPGGNTPSPSSPSPTPTSGSGYSDYRPRHLGHIMRRMVFENSFH